MKLELNTRARLVIKKNDYFNCCPLCGAEAEPIVPYAIFLVHDDLPLCVACIKEQDHDIWAVLEAYYTSPLCDEARRWKDNQPPKARVKFDDLPF